MQLNLNNIDFLVGNEAILLKSDEMKVLPTFSDEVLLFFERLSQKLRKDPRCKAYEDIMAYAFWIRKSSLLKEKAAHPYLAQKVGRGLAFHIAPSNVPINFAVSMTSALLAGNACVIRVSQKAFDQVALICQAINEVLDEIHLLKGYLCIIRYAHDEQITAALSEECDIRIIWGGNTTIQKIRQAPLSPRAIEMAFPDRYSLAIINADAYLKETAEKVAEKFYTDTYYTDQNACSSPRMVIWTGQQIQEAKVKFWQTLIKKVDEVYPLKPVQVVNKWCSLATLAMQQTGVHLVSNQNGVMRIQIKTLNETLMTYKDNSGYFFEYDAQTLQEIVPLLGKTCQTISYLGESPDEIRRILVKAGVKGVDRIMPLGETMRLSFVWDGYHMIDTMSRYIDLG